MSETEELSEWMANALRCLPAIRARAKREADQLTQTTIRQYKDEQAYLRWWQEHEHCPDKEIE